MRRFERYFLLSRVHAIVTCGIVVAAVVGGGGVRPHLTTHTHTYMYIYIYMCVCVRVCVLYGVLCPWI